MTDAKAEPAFTLYERLFMRAYQIELINTVEEGQDPDIDLGAITQRVTVVDRDIAEAYRLMINMRSALNQCANQFHAYGKEHEDQLDNSHLSLVERRQQEDRRDRNFGIAKILEGMLDDHPEPPADDWQPIATGPQDGREVRLLGKTVNGRAYEETGRWQAIKWTVEFAPDRLPPTHWMPLARKPKGY